MQFSVLLAWSLYTFAHVSKSNHHQYTYWSTLILILIRHHIDSRNAPLEESVLTDTSRAVLELTDHSQALIEEPTQPEHSSVCVAVCRCVCVGVCV